MSNGNPRSFMSRRDSNMSKLACSRLLLTDKMISDVQQVRVSYQMLKWPMKRWAPHQIVNNQIASQAKFARYLRARCPKVYLRA